MAPTVLADRYRLERVIGEGEMAVVYRAIDMHLERPVAIKLLRERYASQPRFVELFQREARAAASLSHPNIVSIYDVMTDGAVLFTVMEYVEGQTLKQLMPLNGPLKTAQILNLGIQLADALQWAHDRGITHCDIKPQNILISPGDRVRIADFGIALAVGDSHDAVIGTPEYMSPEQAQGKTPGPVSDVYSAGVVLYEMAAGRLPFSAEDRSRIPQMHVSEPPPPVRSGNPSIPESLEKAILKAMDKNPRRRFQSAGHLAAEFQRIVSTSQQPTDAPPQHLLPAASSAHVRAFLAPVVETLATPVLLLSATIVLFILALVSFIQGAGTLRSAETGATAMAVSADSTARSVQSTSGAVEAMITRSVLDAGVAATARAQIAATALPLQQTATALAASSTAVARDLDAAATARPLSATSIALLTSIQEVIQHSDGRLEHQRDGVAMAVMARSDLFASPVSLRDFVAAIRFSNPYDRSEGEWDYGLGFRSKTPNDGYRLYLDSSGNWRLQLASSGGGKPAQDDLATGRLTSVRVDRGGTNELLIMVKDRLCLFYVNGGFVASLDVSNLNVPGEIWAGTGFVLGHSKPGRATGFQGFRVWPLP